MTSSVSLKNQLSKAFCTKCGTSLDSAKFVPISEMPLITIAHAVCSNCRAENMVTITSIGLGVLPLESDLMSSEVRKYINVPAVSLEEVLQVHKKLKKESVCNLMHKKEKSSVKKQKA